jgi:hypothetical protein
LKQLQASLSGLLSHSRTKHDNATLHQIFVTTRPDLKRVGKGHGMAKVVRLRFGTLCVLVH